MRAVYVGWRDGRRGVLGFELVILRGRLIFKKKRIWELDIYLVSQFCGKAELHRIPVMHAIY